jgi:hypothetical protein
MAEVSDFNARLAAKRAALGECNFMVCACQEAVESPEGFHPVVQHDAVGEVVVALVCGACAESVDLLHGRPVDG